MNSDSNVVTAQSHRAHQDFDQGQTQACRSRLPRTSSSTFPLHFLLVIQRPPDCHGNLWLPPEESCWWQVTLLYSQPLLPVISVKGWVFHDSEVRGTVLECQKLSPRGSGIG